MIEVRIAPDSTEQLQGMFDEQLRHRRCFVLGRFGVGERERCCLVIVHPNGSNFSIGAEAVYLKTDEPPGVGLDLIDLDPTQLVRLEEFVRQVAEPEPVLVAGADSPHLYQRVRQLSLREREVMARQGTLPERVALERTYGGSVWESLLGNPQLSVPEVARIAKNGTLPIPLVTVIVANQAWLSSGEVRRALLGNPRVSGAHLDRVLHAMPRNELRQLAQNCPYRTQVRAAVKKLMGD